MENMKKIVFYVTRDKFTDGIIAFHEMYFGTKQEYIFFTTKDSKYPLKDHNFPVIELDQFMDLFIADYYRKLEACDAFIISGLFVGIKLGYSFSPSILEKTYVNFWGGDYTCFRIRYFLKNLINVITMHARKQIVRQCGGWILMTKGDYDEIRRVAGVDKKSWVAPAALPSDVEMRELFVTKRRKPSETLMIMLGNSAASENCHLDILKKLAHLKNENIHLICPLSYGGPERYVKKVIRKGKKQFSNKFIPIVDFMPSEKYFGLFRNIDVAIYNNSRQQGLGNIAEMLRQGKKVYMRTTTPMWEHFGGRGQKIYDVKELAGITFDNLAKFPYEEALNNINADVQLRKDKWAIILWEQVFRDILEEY